MYITLNKGFIVEISTCSIYNTIYFYVGITKKYIKCL